LHIKILDIKVCKSLCLCTAGWVATNIIRLFFQENTA